MPGKTDVSHQDILAKMDALLKKHHIGGEPSGEGESDFPVLTEYADHAPPTAGNVGDDADGDDFPVLEEILPPPLAAKAPRAGARFPPPAPPAAPRQDAAAEHGDQTLLEQRIADHVLAAMDKALGNLLVQFSSHLETMVRDTVAQELNRQLTALLRDDDEHGGSRE